MIELMSQKAKILVKLMAHVSVLFVLTSVLFVLCKNYIVENKINKSNVKVCTHYQIVGYINGTLIYMDNILIVTFEQFH